MKLIILLVVFSLILLVCNNFHRVKRYLDPFSKIKWSLLSFQVKIKYVIKFIFYNQAECESQDNKVKQLTDPSLDILDAILKGIKRFYNQVTKDEVEKPNRMQQTKKPKQFNYVLT